jgi:hypothetical protein
LRVPPGPERCVDVRPFGPDAEKIDSLMQEDGDMDKPGFRTRDWGLARSGFALRVVRVH